MREGVQDDAQDEGRRQFRIGYAAGVLGLVRFHKALERIQQDRRVETLAHAA
jgi:hypothetical protein